MSLSRENHECPETEGLDLRNEFNKIDQRSDSCYIGKVKVMRVLGLQLAFDLSERQGKLFVLHRR